MFIINLLSFAMHKSIFIPIIQRNHATRARGTEYRNLRGGGYRRTRRRSAFDGGGGSYGGHRGGSASRGRGTHHNYRNREYQNNANDNASQ